MLESLIFFGPGYCRREELYNGSMQVYIVVVQGLRGICLAPGLGGILRP